MPPFYLSICAMFRDEAPYLEEWLAFHLDRGVEHFFLYDHGSSDGAAETLKAFVERGQITVHRWDIAEKIAAQKAAYDHCLSHYRDRSRWIAFIDLDEFLFSPQGALADRLRAYEEFAGVFAFWQCYGSSGHRHPPPGPVTDSYLHRARSTWRRNQRGKSIVDPRRAVQAIGPHHFVLAQGSALVTEAGRPLHFRRIGWLTKQLSRLISRCWAYAPVVAYSGYAIDPSLVATSVFRINHYVVKSRAEYRLKMHKNNLTKRWKKYTLHYFRYHDRNEVFDPVLQGSVPPRRSE